MRVYLAIAITLVAPSMTTAQERGSRVDSDLRAVAKGIRESHQRFLRVPGGLSLEYHLDVAQDPKNKIFIWEQGLDGVISIRWPEFRCKIEGVMSGYDTVSRDGTATRESRPAVRDACYDFEKQVGVMRDSKDLGQVTNYRPSFSAIDSFPLLYQFYSEMDQHYVPGRTLKTEYFLPEAIEQHEYKFAGSETIDGAPCDIIERPGLDRIWVAPSRGHVVLKREYNYGVGKPLKERVLNTRWKEVYSDVWIPMLQTRESFSAKSSLPPVRFTLTVKMVRIGDLGDSDVRVVLSDDIRHIEDHITGMIHGSDDSVADRFENALAKAAKRTSYRPLVIWFNIVIVLGVVLYWIRRRHGQRKLDGVPPHADRT